MGHAEHPFRAPLRHSPPGLAPAARLFEPRGPAPGLPPRRSLRQGKGRISDRWAMRNTLSAPRRPAALAARPRAQRHGSSSHAICGPAACPAHSLGSGLVRPVRRILSLSGPAAALFPPALKRPRSKEYPRARKARQGASALPPAGPGEERAAPSGRHSAPHLPFPPAWSATAQRHELPAEHRPGVIPPPKRRGMAQACRLPRAFRRPPHRAWPAQHRQTRRPAPAAWPSCGSRPRRSLRRETEAARAPALFPPEPLARTLRRTACLPREAQAPHAQFPELSFRP